jgi:phospholipid-translocating ATPase
VCSLFAFSVDFLLDFFHLELEDHLKKKMPEGGRKRIHFSKICSFSCFKSSYRDGHSQIGQKGYSRVVYCNDSDNIEAIQLNYGGNYVSTTKYTAFNFIPKSLFEQFRRVANIYFLVVACVSFSPLAPYTASSIAAPLVAVIGATMAKEAVEDWRRRKQVLFYFFYLFNVTFSSCT